MPCITITQPTHYFSSQAAQVTMTLVLPPTPSLCSPILHSAGAQQWSHMCNKWALESSVHGCTSGHMLYVTAVNTGLFTHFHFCFSFFFISCQKKNLTHLNPKLKFSNAVRLYAVRVNKYLPCEDFSQTSLVS